MNKFDVWVVDEHGNGIEGVEVHLIFQSIFSGFTTEYTNLYGHAEFDEYATGEVEVFLDSESYGKYLYEDGGGITINKYGDEGDSDENNDDEKE